MPLIDELRALADELSPSQFPTQQELERLVGALIYYVDTRLNAAAGPQGTSADPMRQLPSSRA